MYFMSKIRKKVLWLTETAVLLALLICLQWLTKPLGQVVTGSCVNTVLAIAALFVGPVSGMVIALISPVFAYLLNIAPQLVTVPAIMAGNLGYTVILGYVGTRSGRPLWRQIVAWISAAGAKFAVLYVLVVQIICGLASEALLEQGLLKAPMLKALPAMFSWTQLITAAIGGAVALLIAPVLRRALKR